MDDKTIHSMLLRLTFSEEIAAVNARTFSWFCVLVEVHGIHSDW